MPLPACRTHHDPTLRLIVLTWGNCVYTVRFIKTRTVVPGCCSTYGREGAATRETSAEFFNYTITVFSCRRWYPRGARADPAFKRGPHRGVMEQAGREQAGLILFPELGFQRMVR